MQDFLFTSESVTEGHPDKVCDQIADCVLDDILASDPLARVACEVCANTGLLFVFGEITTHHYCNVQSLARQVVRSVGYEGFGGFDWDSCGVIVGITEQSPDISAGVSQSLEAREGSEDPLDVLGAGDQGLMFGYATTESEPYFPGCYMPLPAQLSHLLARQLALARKEQRVEHLRPDGKTQVTVRYSEGRPAEILRVLISTQHDPEATRESLRLALTEQVLAPILPAELCQGRSAAGVEFLCNPSGQFVRGGPEADSGLSGRKIIVDTYGGMARHGGGSFSGKDPSKVDRSAGYYARYAAKNLVAAGAAERLEVQVSYAIGRARPMSLAVDTFGSGKVSDGRIAQLLGEAGIFDFRPGAIIESLGLRRPLYQPVAAYGHFGRSDLDLPWERLDKVDAVRQALGK